MLRLPVNSGVLITGVLRNGPASKAGVQPGDVVVKVGSQVVANTAQLLNAVSVLAPESRVTLTLQRGSKQLELNLQVAQRPAVRREPGD